MSYNFAAGDLGVPCQGPSRYSYPFRQERGQDTLAPVRYELFR